MEHSFGYRRLLFLIYGIDGREVDRVKRIAESSRQDHSGRPIRLASIELWVHSHAGAEPTLVPWSGRAVTGPGPAGA
jgi:hypothetical protein